MRAPLVALIGVGLLASAAFAQTQPPQPVAAQPAPPVAAPVASLGLNRVFEEADTNKDGVVTREEFLAKADRHFGMADTNKDGKITRDEMQAQQSAVMQQMQQNLFGRRSLQDKMNEFMGGTQPAPAGVTAPTPPHVTPPSAPEAPSTQQPIVIR